VCNSRLKAVRLEAEGNRSVATLSLNPFRLASFHPARVLFRPCGVNLRAFLCGVPLPAKAGERNDQIMYASAQPLDFLARTKNASFPNRKLPVSYPVFPDGHQLDWGLTFRACHGSFSPSRE
jgi:hypothetical protein